MRTALITGATRGIGRASALALGDAGWWILATGRDAEAGEELTDELQDRNGGAFQAADLLEEGAPERLVEALVDARGQIDCLVNNAGIHFLATLPEVEPERYDELMALNLRAPFLLSRATIPHMKRQDDGGVIINVSSEAGLSAVAEQAPYNMSKAGLIMLSRSIAVDHASDGIRAISICPGTTRTPLVEQAIASAPDPEAHEQMLQDTRPAGRLGRSEEIAEAVVFAASDRVTYMTGCEIVIDGGKNAT